MIGKVGDLSTEILSLLITHDAEPIEFSRRCYSQLPSDPLNYTLPSAEISKRMDLRDSHLIFAVDPRGCVDIDDSMSIYNLPNGNLQLGIHIADVDYFVPKESPLDR